MEKKKREIADYFGMTLEQILKQKGDLLLEMTLAVERDDLHKLHMLGYQLRLEG